MLQVLTEKDQQMLTEFKTFLDDKEAAEMFITGVAGTGKTTSLNELIEYCIANDISCQVTAYTHKAVKVLSSKLPDPKKVVKNRQEDFYALSTLHSYLKKCPTINSSAVKIEHVDGNAKIAESAYKRIVFVDEFSMVGEQDYMSIAELQYDEETEELVTKFVYIGDPNQLPPVKDAVAVVPKKPYWVKLTKIYRQAGDNPLIDTLLSINDFINGEPAKALEEHETFKRGYDIVKTYNNCKHSKILLAYTNERVQELNAQVQGRDLPIIGDEVFSPTLRKQYNIGTMGAFSSAILTIRNGLLEENSKFKTLETLHDIEGVEFYTLIDEDGHEAPRAIVFGHQSYLLKQQELAGKAVKLNKQIEKQFNQDPKEWSRHNWSHPLAKERAKAWKEFLAFKDCVICLDFNHAMTVHKSQGSTYDFAFVDMEDLSRCAKNDYTTYLKLLYVAISRASKAVYTN